MRSGAFRSKPLRSGPARREAAAFLDRDHARGAVVQHAGEKYRDYAASMSSRGGTAGWIHARTVAVLAGAFAIIVSSTSSPQAEVPITVMYRRFAPTGILLRHCRRCEAGGTV
jgi:hypothetical protein